MRGERQKQRLTWIDPARELWFSSRFICVKWGSGPLSFDPVCTLSRSNLCVVERLQRFVFVHVVYLLNRSTYLDSTKRTILFGKFQMPRLPLFRWAIYISLYYLRAKAWFSCVSIDTTSCFVFCSICTTMQREIKNETFYIWTFFSTKRLLHGLLCNRNEI